MFGFTHRVVFLLLGMSLVANAGVYDDVTTWWHFDYDANQDGIVQTNEVRDQVFWGTAADPSPNGALCTSTFAPTGGVRWVASSIAAPCGGLKYGNMNLELTPLTNALNQVYPASLHFADYNKIPRSCTLVTRIYWKGYATAADKTAWLFRNNYGWGDNTGWLFGIREGKLNFYSRSSGHIGSLDLQPNLWHDVAIVLTDNGATGDTAEYYLWPHGGKLQYQKLTHANDFIKATPLNNGAVIGSELLVTAYGAGNERKCFKGTINHIALWNRVLDQREILEAFSNSRLPVAIGINNGSTDEFGPEPLATGSLAANAPWHTFDSVVSKSRPVEIAFNLDSWQAGLNQQLVAGVLATSAGSAGIGLAVNGTALSSLAAAPGRVLRWNVDGALLKSGGNTIRLTAEGGSEAFASMDYIHLGGSWQIGINNGGNSDFVEEKLALVDAFYHFEIPSGSVWKNVARAATFTKTNVTARFWVSEELVGRGDYVYTVKVIQQGGNLPPHPFIIRLNDEQIYADSAGVADHTEISVPIPAASLRAGFNDLKFQYDLANDEGSGGWIQFDYHRFEIQPYVVPGTVILIQ